MASVASKDLFLKSVPIFRGFNTDTCEMFYSRARDHKINVLFREDEWGFSIVIGTKCTPLVTWQNGVLMEYTGIDDINGICIFEGDIIRNLSDDNCFSSGDMYLTAQVINSDGVYTDSYFHQPITNYKKCEVIGNYFEDQDLVDNLEKGME